MHTREVIRIYDVTQDQLHKLSRHRSNPDGTIVVDFKLGTDYSHIIESICNTNKFDILKQYSLNGEIKQVADDEVDDVQDWY